MPTTLLTEIKNQVPVPIPNKIQLGATTVDVRAVDKAATKALDNAADTMVSAGLGLAIVVAGWAISRWLATASQNAFIRARVEETAASFLGSSMRYMFFLASVMLALNVVGVSLAGAVAVFGAIGLAVAFALRNTLTHVAAGVMLIVNRPFRVGDYIQLDTTVEGIVKRITLFNTEINTLQNKRVFIPNTRIWDNVLQNHTYNEVRAIELNVEFSYDNSPDQCKKVLHEVFKGEDLILAKPEPYISTEIMGESGITYLFRFWVRTRDFTAVRTTIYDKIWKKAAVRGLSFPYPQRVVHMAEMPAKKKKGGR